MVDMPKADPFIGQIVDDYRIESLIGRGGMGAVYRGTDTRLRRPVALKLLLESAAQDRDALARFEREARLVGSINHPNIAQVYRVGSIGSIPYYAMEYLEGRSLQQILAQEGRLSGRSCVKVMIQAAQGLKAAADHGIIHRDIKPGNLVVTTQGVVKLVDFGLAKAFDEDSYQTRTGTVMGTPRYMAPEQGRGEAVDQRADIYSLGASFYHMVAGAAPFEADTAVNMLLQHATAPVTPIPEKNPNVPPRLCNLIYACLEKSPEDRPPDYDSLIAELEAIHHGGPSALGEHTRVLEKPASAATTPTTGSTSQARLYQLAAAGLAALLLLVITVSLLARGGPADAEPPAPPQAATPVERPSTNEAIRTLGELKKFQDQLREED